MVVVGVCIFYFVDDVDGDVCVVVFLFDDILVCMNDGCCDLCGCLFVGLMGYDFILGVVSLLWVDVEFGIIMVLFYVMVLNGVGFVLDGWCVYYIDIEIGCIDVFDVVDGDLCGC